MSDPAAGAAGAPTSTTQAPTNGVQAPQRVVVEVAQPNGGGQEEGQWRRVEADRLNRLTERARLGDEAVAAAAAAQAAADAAQAELARVRFERDRDVALLPLASTLPDLGDGEVREFIGEQYRKAAARAGDQPPAFGAWLAEVKTNPPPLMRAYFTPPAVVVTEPPVAQTQAKPPPNVDAGRAAPPPPQGRMTPEQIVAASANFRRDPETYIRALEQQEADGFLSRGSAAAMKARLKVV